MNVAIILAGGTGTRLGGDIPKQYIEVAGKPIISYCLEKFEKHPLIDSIVVVAAESWQAYINEWIDKDKVTKFSGFALAGSSRQHSIANGLALTSEIGASDGSNVIIHDAARPNVSHDTISACINELQDADGVMPVIPVKDTIYLSKTGCEIDALLNRDQLFAGQAPESFDFKKYFEIHKGLTESELESVRGSSEIAYRNGFKMRLIPGDEHNYKITTIADLDKFRTETEK